MSVAATPGERPAPPVAVAFRRMLEDDLPRVIEIELQGFAHPWSPQLLLRELAHAWSTVLLAVEPASAQAPERVVGFIVYWVVHDEMHVLNLASAGEVRRRGVGRALMDEAMARARQAGAATATLEVRRSNAPALALYGALGFRQVAVRPNYYADEGEDAIVMNKPL